MLNNLNTEHIIFQPEIDNNRLTPLNLEINESFSNLLNMEPLLTKVTTALILGAGDGTRLRPLTLEKPKVMINIWGVPILERLLYNLKMAGITKAIIIVGYKSHVIKDHFGSKYNGIDIIYREAKNYEDGILTSAVLGKDVVNERFIFLLGDTIFEVDTIKRALKMRGDLVVGIRNERIDESVGAFVDNNDRIRKIGMLKEMTQWNRVVTGLAVCEPVFFDSILECVEKTDYDRPSAMQLMVEKGYNVQGFDMTDDAWWENDDHEDLKKCKKEIFDSSWKRRFTSKDLNIFKNIFNLPISIPLTKITAMTSIKPNHLTLISLCFAFLACGSFALGHFIIGGIFCYTCAMVDAVDGKISRLKLQESALGSFLDSVVDRFTELAIVAGLSYGIFLKTGNLSVLLIGFLASIAWLGRFYLKELFIDKAGLDKWKSIKSPWLDFTGHRDFSFFITLICCIGGMPLIPLIWMAFFGNLLSSIKLYDFFKHFK